MEAFILYKFLAKALCKNHRLPNESVRTYGCLNVVFVFMCISGTLHSTQWLFNRFQYSPLVPKEQRIEYSKVSLWLLCFRSSNMFTSPLSYWYYTIIICDSTINVNEKHDLKDGTNGFYSIILCKHLWILSNVFSFT